MLTPGAPRGGAVARHERERRGISPGPEAGGGAAGQPRSGPGRAVVGGSGRHAPGAPPRARPLAAAPGAGRGPGRSDPPQPSTAALAAPPRCRAHTVQCARSLRSMLRAAALAAAGLGPRLGRRLLSAAATEVVPAPNQQPEVFYNQVRPPAPGLCSLREKEPAEWEGPGVFLGPILPSWGLRGLLRLGFTHTLAFLP